MISLPALIFISYILLGAIAGFIGGLLGLGGGIVIVPALLFLFIQQGFHPEVQMHMALATSLATIIFTSISSAWAHHRRGAVLWKTVNFLVPGIVIGCVLGAWLADQLETNVLRIAFGIFELLVAMQVMFGFKPSPQRELPGVSGSGLTGTVLGSVSTILGIGGGTLSVPFLLWCNVNIRNAVATSSALGFPIAVAGTATFILAGLDSSVLPDNSLGYVYLPAAGTIIVTSIVFAPLGARVAHAIPIVVLRRIFAILLACIGIRMLL